MQDVLWQNWKRINKIKPRNRRFESYNRICSSRTKQTAKQIGSEVETICQNVNGLEPLTIFAKKLHQRCFLKPKIRLHRKMKVNSNKYFPLKLIIHSLKSIRIRSFSWSVFSNIRAKYQDYRINIAVKCGTGKTPDSESILGFHLRCLGFEHS